MKKFIIFLICIIHYLIPTAQIIDPWKIKVDNINPSNYYGVTVANGNIGIVSSPEPLKVKDVILAGSFDNYGRGRVSNFLHGFNLLNASITIDNELVKLANISNFTQEINFKTALFTVSFDFKNKATITYYYTALRQLPFCVLMNITIKAKKNILIGGSSILEAPDALKDVQNYYNEIDRPHALISLISSSSKSPTGKLNICAANTFLFPEPLSQKPKIIHEMWDNNLHLIRFTKNILKDSMYNYSIVGSTISSAQHPDPLNEAERLTIYASLEGTDRLLKRHLDAWQALWKSDIIIDGEPQVQQDIHNMLYHLYSFGRAGNDNSPSPMGLSGLGYNGHVFWDTELWMFPALLIMQQGIAKSMLEYRFKRLEAAKKNAYILGFNGAMYPWESADLGVEETPVWALSGPFEHHITACVAIACWNYFCVTQDTTWLKEKGFSMIKETANFWLSRVEKNKQGLYEINNVVAADEWAENVNNNAFTNAAAKWNLKYATLCAKILNEKINPLWEEVANKIIILKMQNGVTAEHETYKGENIKQSDVNLLSFPLHEIVDIESVKKDLYYYETRVPTEGTPAMTEAIFSILHTKIGEVEKGYMYFKKSFEENLNPPFRVLAETKNGTNPYFGTGAGGIIQALIFGFGGYEISPAGIIINAIKLPNNWKSLKINRSN